MEPSGDVPVGRPAAPPTGPVLEVRHLTKHFGGVTALRDATFAIGRGEVIGLVGANGAGKSTLINVLTGQFAADLGEIVIDGVRTRVTSPHHAAELGIGVVHQELDLVPDLDVAENLFLGAEHVAARRGVLDRTQMRREALPLLQKVGLRIDPSTPVRDLSIGDQQLIAAARGLRVSDRVLLLDEPTSSLTPHEAQRLFTVMRSLSDAGTSVVFISHRLNEVIAACSRVVVLRDGQTVGEFDADPRCLVDIVDAMVPGSAEFTRRAQSARQNKIVLDVSNLQVERRKPVSFTVAKGEVVGIFGLVGAGKSTLARTIAGLHRPVAGTITLDGHAYRPAGTPAAYRRGVAYLSEDRRNEGILRGLSVRSNMVVRTPRDTARRGVLRRSAITALVKHMTARLNIKAASDRLDIGSLSGGNQQKVLVARLLAENLKVLLLDEPTHGIDVRAKQDLLEIVEGLAARGVAVVIISSEIPELQAACDRILVLRDGTLTAEYQADQTDDRQLMAAATKGFS